MVKLKEGQQRLGRQKTVRAQERRAKNRQGKTKQKASNGLKSSADSLKSDSGCLNADSLKGDTDGLKSNALTLTSSTPSLPQKRCVLFVVAGEASGDLLGSETLKALDLKLKGLEKGRNCGEKTTEKMSKPLQSKRLKIHYDVHGVGGPLMEGVGGFRSLVPFETFSVTGLGFLARLPQLIKAYCVLKKAIWRLNPDILLTFDAPDLSFRLARSAPFGVRKVHCVAPSVWAWRSGRAAKIAKFLDHLAVLFPFEPRFFRRHGLATTFVGHPKVLQKAQDAGAFWRHYPHLSPDVPLLILMPGSRESELRRLLFLFYDVVTRVKAQRGDVQVVLLTLPHLKEKLEKTLPWDITLIVDPAHHLMAMRVACAALAASGTATLELALAMCPMVVAYRVGALLAWVLRCVVKTRFVSLPNILLKKAVVPELLQEKATVLNLTQQVCELLKGKAVYRRQKTALKHVHSLLHSDNSFKEHMKRILEAEFLKTQRHTQGSAGGRKNCIKKSKVQKSC